MIRRVPAFDDEQQCPFVQGDVYQRKLPGLSGRPSFRVTMPPIRQKLGDVTQRQVIAEGRMDGRRALERWRIEWVKHNDLWARRLPNRTASDEDVLRRWRTHHASGYCWVLTIALLDPVLKLAQQDRILRDVAQRGTRVNAGLPLNDADEYTTGATIDWHASAVDRDTLARIVEDRREAHGLTDAQRRLRQAGRKFSRIAIARRSA